MQLAKTSRRVRFGALAASVVLVAAACEPGWMNPVLGSGDGSGTTPGLVAVAEADVALSGATAVAAAPDGGFYAYDGQECVVYHTAKGETTRYAGTPGVCAHAGDGGPATDAAIQSVLSDSFTNVLASGLDGTLYIAGSGDPLDGGSPVIRIVSPDGTITSSSPAADGSMIVGVTVAPDGTVFAGTALSGNIVRLESDGTLTTVYSGTATAVVSLAAISSTELVFAEVVDGEDGTPLRRLDLATSATTELPIVIDAVADSVAIAVGPDGMIYLAASSALESPGSVRSEWQSYVDQVVRVDPDGNEMLIAGTGTPDPGTGRQYGDSFSLDLSPAGLSMTPNGGLLVSSGHVVYRLEDPAGVLPPPITIPVTTLPGT